MALRRILSMLVMVTMVFSLVACTGKQANNTSTENTTTATEEEKSLGIELMQKAHEKMHGLRSYEANMELDFEFVNAEGSSSAKVSTEIVDFEDPTLIHIKIQSTDSEGNEVAGTSEFYVEEKESEQWLYLTYDNKWFKANTDDETLFYTLGQYDMGYVVDVFMEGSSNPVSMGKEEINGVSTTIVRSVVAQDKVAEILVNSGVFIAAGLFSLTVEYLEGAPSMAVDFWIDEEGNVMKISFDAGEAYQTISDNVFALVEGQEGYEEAERLVVDKYKITTTFDAINSGERFEIPQEALNAELMDLEEGIN